MKSTSNSDLGIDELRDLMFKPLSSEEIETSRKADQVARWLFIHNLQEMEPEVFITIKQDPHLFDKWLNSAIQILEGLLIPPKISQVRASARNEPLPSIKSSKDKPSLSFLHGIDLISQKSQPSNESDQNEADRIIQSYPKDDMIIFYPMHYIARARLWFNEELLLYRENWQGQEPSFLPIEFVIYNPNDNKNEWRFKEGLRWEIMEVQSTDGTP